MAHRLSPGRLAARFIIAAISAVPPASALPISPQAQEAVGCREWRECRQLALDAAARGEYETFHDLAWRSVQTGPPRDPDLMYLLARAQCLSGRPHDALVMLRRLADMGVATDAGTNDDFRRTRALPGWVEIEAITQQLRSPDASATPPADLASRAAPIAPPQPDMPSAPAPPTPAPPPPSAAPIAATTLRQAPVEVAARFSTQRFAAGGLAYDAVSSRFVVGDATARKLMVVAEGRDRTIDMVGPDSAGFHRVMALEIDARRGDLWVVSAATDGHSALHKLQLVSGRPLAIFAAPAELEPLDFRDVAITGAGEVLVLDRAGRRLLVLEPGGKTIELVMRIDAHDPAGLAPAGDERMAYVAHRTGIVRLDLKSRMTRDVTAPDGITLGGFDRLKWYRNALVGVQAGQDGSRRIVRLDLDRSGRSVTAATVIDASLPADTGPPFATLSGDDLYYMVTAPDGERVEGPALAGARAEVVVRRIRLR